MSIVEKPVPSRKRGQDANVEILNSAEFKLHNSSIGTVEADALPASDLGSPIAALQLPEPELIADDALGQAGADPDDYGSTFADGNLWTADDDPYAQAGEPFELDPQAGVESWRIGALGRRPKDFMARDLLLGSLWRDERPRVFHSLAKKPPAWLEDHVAQLPGKHREQATQLAVLHYLHRRQLARLWQRDYQNWEMEIDGQGILKKLWDCWPYGALMARSGQEQNGEQAPRRRCCRLAWLCPWCYARHVVRLRELLRDGPLRQRQGKHLVRAWLSTYGAHASPDNSWQRAWLGKCDTGAYYLQSPSKVRRMRRAITTKLRDYARQLGITGGLLTHQISPWRTGHPVYRRGVPRDLTTFRHDYALLGEVTLRTEEERARFQDLTAFNHSQYGRIELTDPSLLDGSIIFLTWSSHPADDPRLDALRLFLAGSSLSYPVQHLEAPGGRREDLNRIRGAFALQPHFMMDEVQWWSYAAATRDLPLYVPFGTWRTAIHNAKKERRLRRKAALLLPSPQRQAASKRRTALQAANRGRSQTAQAQLEQLLKVARPFYQQVLAEPRPTRGRPAHRARLRQLLAQNGHTVTDHQLKGLMGALRDAPPS
jgi:hypothetical protein